MMSRYSDYTTRIGDDYHAPATIQEEPGHGWARFYYRVFRIPSQKAFVLRMCPDATETERANAAAQLTKYPAGLWEQWPDHKKFKRRRSDGTYTWHLLLGRRIEDPLVQLELEMMIDDARWNTSPVLQ